MTTQVLIGYYLPGLYLKELEGHKLSVFVAVDTLDDLQVEMTEFLSEVQAILRLYLRLNVDCILLIQVSMDLMT